MSDLLNFSGMLQTTTSSFLRKDDQLEHAVNVHGDSIGSVTKRLGYTIQGSAISSTSVRGLVSYPDISAGTTRLFAASNGSVFYFNGTIWTSVYSYGTVGANISFKVFLDKLFLVGADSSDTYITTALIDGTTSSTSGDVASAPGGKYLEVFKDRLFMADTYVGSTRYASRFYESSVPDVSTYAITWPATNYEEILPYNGEALMGIHANNSLNQLLLFKENSLHSYDLTTIKNVGAVGTSSHWSIQTIGFITFWFKAGEGIYAYSGIQPQLISRPIEKWIRGIQGTVTPFAGKEYERIYKCYVGDIIVDGVTYSNCEIRYSVPDNTFTIYSYAEAFTSYGEHSRSGTKRLYAGTSLGKVHELAQGNDQVYSDDGTAIGAEFMTKAFDFGKPASKKFIDKVQIYATNCQALTGRVRARGKDWSTFFTIDEGEQMQGINPDEGRFHQFHFSERSTLKPFQFEGISPDPIETSSYVHG